MEMDLASYKTVKDLGQLALQLVLEIGLKLKLNRVPEQPVRLLKAALLALGLAPPTSIAQAHGQNALVLAS